MMPIHDLSPDWIKRFVQVDGRSCAAIVALDPHNNRSFAGVARYAAIGDSAACEFAVTIADVWHGRGLGHALMQRLIAHARFCDRKSLVGFILKDNLAMIHLARKLGFAIKTDPESPDSLVAEMDLAADAPS